MADVKISQLPAATTPLAGTEEVPLVQSGQTRKATVADIVGAAGGVTAVTGTAPVVSTGGTTPDISMPAATTSASGYLTSTDWNTFNNKIDTLTSTDGSVTVSGTGASRDLSVAYATDVVVQVRNNTGATLSKGTVVYISGATGQLPTVSKAIASGDPTSAQTLGLVRADIANNTNGYVVTTGLVTNINTSAYADGAQLYLSPTTAGAFTTTKPYAPDHLVYVGIVEYSNAANGKIFVNVQNGYELEELHNVSAQTPSNGQTIVYNSSTQLWENAQVGLTNGVTGVLPVANGGSGTATPSLVAGTNVTISGTWPNQTINASGGGTVTSVSVATANGLAGTVANPTTTPAITLSTSVTGMVKGNGTALSAATAGTDYVAPGGALGTPSSGTATNLTGLPLSTGVTGVLPIANGGNGTATPTLTAGTNVSITGTWPNYTIAATGGSGGGNVSGPGSSTDNAVVRFDGTTGQLIQNSNVQINDSGEFNVGVWKATEIGISYGGTGAATAIQARGNLLPSYTSNAGKVLAVNTGATDVEWVSAGGSGTVTSVALTVPSGFSVSGSPITSSGTLAITTAINGVVYGNGTGLAAATIGTGLSFSAGTLSNSSPMTYPGAGIAVSTGSAWGTSLTAPSGAIVGTTDIQTLTNKTISGASNTLSNIGNASLTNSSVTVNGTAISLGASGTVTATATNALTIGTGLSGTSYNGSAAVTIAIDSTVATLSGIQILTNKIISGASNTLANIGNASLTNSSVTVNGTAISLGASGTVTVPISTGVTGLGTGVATALAVNVGTAGAPVVNGGALGTPSSGTLSSCTADGTNPVGFKNIPPVGTKTSSYSLATTDVGKYVQIGTGGSIIIPDATFAEGDVVSLFNNTSGTVTITCNITTAYIAGTYTDKATMTLAAAGVATILFISSTLCVVNGNVS